MRISIIKNKGGFCLWSQASYHWSEKKTFFFQISASYAYKSKMAAARKWSLKSVFGCSSEVIILFMKLNMLNICYRIWLVRYLTLGVSLPLQNLYFWTILYVQIIMESWWSLEKSLMNISFALDDFPRNLKFFFHYLKFLYHLC